MINLKLFGYADSQDVIVGKDGWYFFAGGMSFMTPWEHSPFTRTMLPGLADRS